MRIRPRYYIMSGHIEIWEKVIPRKAWLLSSAKLFNFLINEFFI